MPAYFAGLNPSPLFNGNCVVDRFREIPLANVTDVYIDWYYFLLWRSGRLWITGSIGIDGVLEFPKELNVPDNASGRCLLATGGTDSITVLTTNDEVWRYMIYEGTWKKIPRFIPSDGAESVEKIVKMKQAKGVVALTNLGRVFNVPVMADLPENVKIIDISCGVEHTLMLVENGDVYSMGNGMRGQLGHGDLEWSDEPLLIEALAGLKVAQISTGGWSSAALTNEGDLYFWGWNNEGQMGLDVEQKVIVLPTLVEFKDESGQTVELTIAKVQCTSYHSLILTDEGTLWACGSNKYGQLGRDTKTFSGTKKFVKLLSEIEGKRIVDVKCRVEGSVIFTGHTDPVR